ncbi:Gfo/Idh/MocA family protein [Pelagibacterium lentulum]|uniref:Dehydrogenase n=1 Tax=Pelagibacterium lentulum TaxID=2029865 RepID=A0A916VWE3_9HYPH|nr:Gfo/Idh/MocA family oxidoreductase [Pelagibacterium lentulum]GGA46289.1 dehydrogenase [Pelagibacterium lentulum]
MNDTKHKIAIVGFGKIARDQHVPSIAGEPAFDFAAAVSRNATAEGVDNFDTLEALFANRPDIGCVALCTPPQVRFDMAAAAINAGKHVLLEKPPGSTLAEIDTLIALAEKKGVVLFATWHSRYAAAVEPAKAWLKDKTIEKVEIVWREDVRRWHPGQAWIWEPGGLGVFDPAINGLSILTAILPDPIHVTRANLEFPENCQTPIAAQVDFTDARGTPVKADFDWRQTGPQTWDIVVSTREGEIALSMGGSRMAIDGVEKIAEPDREYAGIYAHFAELLESGTSLVDASPLRHVADAMMLGRRTIVEAFYD